MRHLFLKVIFRLFPKLFYYQDGSPKRCTVCGSKKMGSKIIDTIEYTVAEEEIFCDKCGAMTGYFAYGYYAPDFTKYGAAPKVIK